MFVGDFDNGSHVPIDLMGFTSDRRHGRFGFNEKLDAGLNVTAGMLRSGPDLLGGFRRALRQLPDLLCDDFPASPARAASSPAFRARRFIWNAILPTTLFVLPNSRDDVSIAFNAATTLLTTNWGRDQIAADESEKFDDLIADLDMIVSGQAA